MGTSTGLPHWQLDSIFPGLDSEQYRAARAELDEAVGGLERFCEANGIEGGAALDASSVTRVFDELVASLDDVYTRFGDIRAYLYGFISTDAFDDRARSEDSRLRPLESRLSTLAKRATAWLGRLEPDGLTTASEVARAHAYWLRREMHDAEHLMSGAEEALASILVQTGSTAWGRLHGDLISRDTIEAEVEGEPRDYTVAQLKNLQRNADRAVRARAYRAELDLLRRHEVAYAAAMNSIKGEVEQLNRRRGWRDSLAASAFEEAITETSLAAMQQACRERFPAFRRYLNAKARMLGRDRLAWYDLLAPVQQDSGRTISWDEAKSFVIDRFGAYTERLAAYAQRAFDEGWIDVPPRKGKRNGAFCMAVPGRKESRILLNFGETLDDVFTLAHELGHGYHNDCRFRAGRTALQASTPPTLAETASIFCETIVTNAMLDQADDRDRLQILEQDLLSATQIVVDIDSRFRFEKAVLEQRRNRELTIDELKRLMLDAQAATYGDALESDERHELMWAQKPHYYAYSSFYNYPYTFGYLLGLGLYAEYRRDRDGFPARYDDFLSSTGMADAASLAAAFGIDIEDPAFWRGGLAVVEDRVGTYETLAKEHA